MHALKRFGTAFGGYKMMENYPVPECGPDDIILEIKAAAICGADMKHWGVDNGQAAKEREQIALIEAAIAALK